MVFWWVAAAFVAIVYAASGSSKKEEIQIDFSNKQVIEHYDEYVWNSPQYNPGNT